MTRFWQFSLWEKSSPHNYLRPFAVFYWENDAKRFAEDFADCYIVASDGELIRKIWKHDRLTNKTELIWCEPNPYTVSPR